MRINLALLYLFVSLSASVLASLPTSVTAAELRLPDDPRQSIGYWKAHTLSVEQDHRVELAQSVFTRLLRAWDNSRVAPGLYVINSTANAWAASLADGNILLSLEAIDISLRDGAERGEHLLAFVLAHELAHQRSDDLWHQRFFRNLRFQSEAQREQLLEGLPIDIGMIQDLEQKEAQADRDGLVLMASVGFDPWQVLSRQDFFTRWVESIWNTACDQQGSDSFHQACEQAHSRALRAKFQLDTVAGQSVIYDMGIQALVAGDYSKARHYFTLYGREYPGRAVMSAIGNSYLAEAIETRKKMLKISSEDQINFYFPLLLDGELDKQKSDNTQAKRAASSIEVDALRQKLNRQITLAVQFIEKAIRLDPEHKPLYLSLAIAHLIENNQYLVSGVLRGRYMPKFGDDAASSMLLALNQSLQGNHDTAVTELLSLLDDPELLNKTSVIVPDLLQYAITVNLARLYKRIGRAADIPLLWQTIANRARADGQTFLFRLALQNLAPGQNAVADKLQSAPSIKGVRLGDRKPRDDSAHKINELWIEGELFHVYIYEDGARFISAADGRIINASQVGGISGIANLIQIGEPSDRPLKSLGIPDRRIHLSSGEYIAYDRYGLALRLDDSRVKGWFLYP